LSPIKTSSLKGFILEFDAYSSNNIHIRKIESLRGMLRSIFDS